jgi:Flp pilus assembly pilin Flp
VRKLFRLTDGQDLIEYSLLIALISVAIVVNISSASVKVTGMYEEALSILNGSHPGDPADPNGAPASDPGNGEPSNGNPNPGNGNPGNGHPNPGNGNPGNGNPNPGNGNPGNGNPNPGNGNPGNGNPNPGNGNPGGNPGGKGK